MNTTGSKLSAQEIITSEASPPMHIPHTRNQIWENWGRTARCQPEFSFYPQHVDDLIQIVNFAREQGLKIRVAATGHSWSDLVTTDRVLVYVHQLNKVTMDLSDDARPKVMIESGATVKEVNDVLEEQGYTLPLNVVLESVRFGGLIATGSHGSGWNNPTLSDLVHAIEVVTASGEVRKFEAGADSMDQVAETFEAHDYVQYFWFPLNREVTLQTSDVTDEPATWTRFHEWGKFVNGWMETGATHLVKPLLVKFPQITPHFTRFAGNSMKAGEHIMDQSDNMLLGQWINYMVPSLNASVSFPPGPKCVRVQEAWYVAVDLIEASVKEGRYPANLAMNTRLFGRNTALLHSIPGDENETTCNIQLTSFDNKRWEAFKDCLMERWLAIPGSRPHWAKQYQNLPGIADKLRAVYGENLETFLRIRKEARVDPDNIFVNSFLEDLLFSDSVGADH